MTMEKGDIVNVKSDDTYLKGVIKIIYNESLEEIKYCEPIAVIKDENNLYLGVLAESKMEFKDGEWWEVRL